jgi:hypothetical protein
MPSPWGTGPSWRKPAAAASSAPPIPLEPTATATTVRVQNGKVLITDGPFAETKEQLAGYYILDCQDLDEALAWAAQIPTGCRGGAGCVEVRPIREMRGLVQPPMNG